jgi:two-component system chemotaxis response regulator CheY
MAISFLVVDDSSTMRKILRNILESQGYDKESIIEAENGKEAWEEIQTGDFDLVLTDWNMPVMNGLELVERIKGEDKYKALPIIMITTEGGKTEVITALKAGVNNYVVKPFQASQVIDKIDIVLNQA